MRNAKLPTSSTRRKGGKEIKQRFPRGWNEKKVRAVIHHYEHITDEGLAHEIETAQEVTDETLISVPTELVPAVQKLILRHRERA